MMNKNNEFERKKSVETITRTVLMNGYKIL